MPANHLESLVAEWYEIRGYFVRRNVQVGKRTKGGYECELDIVAFHPEQRSIVHVEPSLDALSWAKREARYRKKFEAGRRHIPGLFPGLAVPKHIEQIALFVFGGGPVGRQLAGGRVMLIRELMAEIPAGLAHRRVESAAVPEEYPLLRTLQFASQYWKSAG
jgi:hypothetical protein